MRAIVGRFAASLLLALPCAAARAAITCSAASPGFSAFYLPTEPQEVVQSTVTVTCTRTSAADPVSVGYELAVNNGLNGSGSTNQARIGGSNQSANRINYETWRGATCAMRWSNAGGGRIAGTVSFAGTGTFSQTQNWWACIPSGQDGRNAGTFTDLVTMSLTLDKGTVVGAPFTFPATIVHPARCTISPTPGNVSFSYTSFSATAANAASSFGLNCTRAMPYTMTLDAYGGTLLGLSYSLSLSGGTGTIAGTGTGTVVTIPIVGTIAAGQSGTCASGSCNASRAHTITITY